MSKNILNFLTAIFMWLISYFYISNTLTTNGLGFSITIFTVLILLVSLYFIKSNNIKVKKESYIYFVYVLLIGLSFSIFIDSGKKFIKILVLFISLGYWLIVASDSQTNDELDQNILKDLFMKIFFVPMSKLYLLPKNLFFKISIKDKKTTNVIIGLIIVFPLIIIVSSLLSNTDETFRKLINFSINLDFLYELNIFYIVVSFFLASGLFSALYINVNKIKINDNLKALNLDKLIIKTILISMILIYVLYLSSVSFTYINHLTLLNSASDISNYARSGFYELCGVSFINFILFIVCKWLVSEVDLSIKHLLIIIAVQTLILSLLALLRLFVYINIYGLTYLRIYALIFIFLMFFVIVLLAYSLYSNINYTKISVIIGSSVFLALCYINVGNLILKYNLSIKQEIRYYDKYKFGYEITPFLIEKYNNEKDVFEKNELKNNLIYIKNDISNHELLHLNLELIKYKEMLEDIN
ncbi:MAG: DUF4173 domain-containing protein [Erysipelotrichaceae bacterium]|nr:DUF4173 domain-containing protein [Erysipelotrichaceae bacterium]